MSEPSTVFADANLDAILNTLLYMNYSPDGQKVNVGQVISSMSGDGKPVTLESVVASLNANSGSMDAENLDRLNVLNNALNAHQDWANAEIVNQIDVPTGLSGIVVKTGDNDFSVVFRGTNTGQWIDNGIGLSGIPRENTYFVYDSNGNVIDQYTIANDYATPEEVNALNWFNKMAAQYGWTTDTNIDVSGHSKGGNTAQFIAINSALVNTCFSFDGQGFSPKAIAEFKERYGEEYFARIQKIYSISAYNDYVNILGIRVAPESNTFFLDAPEADDNFIEYHFMERMLDENGNFNGTRPQGEIADYIEKMNRELMKLDPEVRQMATLGVMNILQRLRGGVPPVGGEEISGVTAVIGPIIAALPLVSNLLTTADGKETIVEVAKLYGEGAIESTVEFFHQIGEKHGPLAEAGAIVFALGLIAYAAPFVAKTAVVVNSIVWMSNAFIIMTSELLKVSREVYAKVKNFVSNVSNAFTVFCNSLFAGGSMIVDPGDLIVIDTVKLRNYADALRRINRAVSDIDRRMDALYSRVGFLDLFNLMQADIIMKYSKRLEKCASYLNATADEFDAVEYSIRTGV